ncbi:hypothetical protein BC940DRAFT_291105 [Gongronella butleri]|nr:hypothetical protein BC940DRAFT_291105 [Gongronella butleri]
MCPEAMLQQGGHGNRAQRRALQREQNKAAKKAAKKALKQGDAPATVSSKKMHRKRPATPISLSKMTPNGTSEEEEDDEIKDTRSLPGTPRPITRQAISGDATTIAPMHTPTTSQSSSSNSSNSSSNSDAVDSIVLMTTPVPSNTSEFSELVSETNGSDNHGSTHDAPETPKMEEPMTTEPMTTPIPSNHTHVIDHDASIAPKDETVPSNNENSTYASSEPSASSESAQKTKNAAEGDKKEKKEALASLEMNKHEAVAAPSSCVGDEHPEDGEIMVIASPMEMVHEQKPNKTPISTTAALASKATTMTRKSSMMDEIDDQAPLTEWVTQHSLLCDSRAPSLHAPDLEKDDHSSSSSSSATSTATTTITAHAVDDIASTLKRSTSCTLSEKDVDNNKDIPNSADHADDHAMKQGPCEPSEPNKPLVPKAAAVVAPKTAKIHRLLVATLKKKTKQLKRSYAFWKPKSHVTRDDALKMP